MEAAGTKSAKFEPLRRARRSLDQGRRLVTYTGKARKAIYRDADGSEIGFVGAID